MPAYNVDYAKFAGLDAQVVGISCDSTYCHIGWQQKDIGILLYPLASDYYPHGAVAEKYGVLRSGPPLPGISERAIYIVDTAGKIVFTKLYELGQQPPNDEVLAQLATLGKSSGGAR